MSPNNALAPLLIKASAGTGKTYQLTGRLLAILVAGAAPDSVLASTFTRKAAGEILQRLFAALASGAADDSGN
ncbi:MAG: UvrD-helicase domain-containing protein, partial [Planctomycetota bacterium]